PRKARRTSVAKPRLSPASSEEGAPIHPVSSCSLPRGLNDQPPSPLTSGAPSQVTLVPASAAGAGAGSGEALAVAREAGRVCDTAGGGLACGCDRASTWAFRRAI